MATVSAKLRYLLKTKRLIKEAIQSGVKMPDDTVFRKYPDYIHKIKFQLCEHETAHKYIPDPNRRYVFQIETNHETPGINPTCKTVFIYKPKHAKHSHLNVKINDVSYSTFAGVTNQGKRYTHHIIDLPQITHETEVNYE